MSDNDTSDEGALEEYRKNADDGDFPYEEDAYLKGWRECRRRFEAQMEERERKAFEAGFFYYQSTVDYTESDAHRVDNGYRAFREADK